MRRMYGLVSQMVVAFKDPNLDCTSRDKSQAQTQFLLTVLEKKGKDIGCSVGVSVTGMCRCDVQLQVPGQVFFLLLCYKMRQRYESFTSRMEGSVSLTERRVVTLDLHSRREMVASQMQYPQIESLHREHAQLVEFWDTYVCSLHTLILCSHLFRMRGLWVFGYQKTCPEMLIDEGNMDYPNSFKNL